MANKINDIIPDLNWLWNETLGHPAVCVAIIDGWVNKEHPAIQTSDLEVLETNTGWLTENKGTASSHGTHIASIIFGRHGSEVKGIAPQCKGLNLPVFFDNPSGGITPCSQLDLARAITQAIDAGANIINISGGEWSDSGTAHPILTKAICYCQEKNVMVVAAAGNDGCACLHIPSALPWVLVVGGMDEKGNPLNFSNWGDAYRINGILAPGENIPGAEEAQAVAYRTGTSYATAIVSGIAALMLSIQKKQGDRIAPNAIREAFLESALGCANWESNLCQRLLKGRINIKGAYSIICHHKKERTMNDLPQSKEPPPMPEPPPFTAGQNEHELAAAGVFPSHAHAEMSQYPVATVPAQTQQGIQASDCGCGGSGETCSCNSKKSARTVQIVFALGTLGYDLVSEARRDSIAQHTEGGNPNDPVQLLKYLDANPWEAASVTWVLNLDATPVYAIQPYGAFAAESFKRLREFLSDQIKSGADRISVPGFIAGQIRLMSGQVVPVIMPELRCMYNWNIAALLESVLGKAPIKDAEKEAYEQQKLAVANFLERTYHELRNLGTSPQDRAINYAATNALNTAGIFAEALKDGMQLDTIEVERSPICRIDSDCWDVVLCFFDPEKQLVRARKCYRFTVDVSDVCPVMVGAVRAWFVR